MTNTNGLLDMDLDEYCSSATRKLYIGNLERDITYNDLRNKLHKYGEIIDIEIKKEAKVNAGLRKSASSPQPSTVADGLVSSPSSSPSANQQQQQMSYAFVQFCSIKSVLKAIRCMDGKYIGNQQVKLSFG